MSYLSERLCNAFFNGHTFGCIATPRTGEAIDTFELREVAGTPNGLCRCLETGRVILKSKPLIVVTFIRLARSLMLRKLNTANLTNVSLKTVQFHCMYCIVVPDMML